MSVDHQPIRATSMLFFVRAYFKALGLKCRYERPLISGPRIQATKFLDQDLILEERRGPCDAVWIGVHATLLAQKGDCKGNREDCW